MEIWKDVVSYEGRYMVSNEGRIKSLLTNKILKQFTDHSGYKFVQLAKDNKSHFNFVHRLVAIAFIENPNNKPQVNHKDGIRTNNNYNNLEWVTARENIQYSFDVLHKKSNMKGRTGKKNKLSIPVFQYNLEGLLVNQWDAVSDAARALNCQPSEILSVVHGRTITARGFIWSYEKSDKIDNSKVLNKKTHKYIKH